MNKFLLTLAVLFTAVIAQARTITSKAYSGSGNGLNWETASTWDAGVLPASGDLVIIPSNSKVYLRNSFTVQKLDLRISGTLTLTQGGTKLTIGQAGYQYLTSRNRIIVFEPGMIVLDNTGGASKTITVDGNIVANPSSNTTTIIGGALNPNQPQSGDRMAISSSQLNGAGAFEALSFRTLPVKFIAFTAVRRNSEVLVQWATAQEENSLSYEVELSTDGRNWSAVGSVKAAGNSETEKAYQFTATNLPAGTLQFRVKQLDIDGKFTYTAVRTVKPGKEGASVQLSAVAGKVVVQFGQEVKGATVRIMNLNGQVLQEQKIASAFGQVLIPTSVKGFVVVAILNENEIAASRQLVF